MQPPFRRGPGIVPIAIYDVEDGSVWDPLRKSGPNGLVSILTLLVWWGRALLDRSQYQDDSSASWREMVLDVKACMSSILATTDMARKAKKRKGKAVDNEKSVKRYVFLACSDACVFFLKKILVVVSESVMLYGHLVPNFVCISIYLCTLDIFL